MASILIVDDDESIVDLIRLHLATTAHSVFTARDGREALDRIGTTPMDLIITDIYMPEMDGLELISSLRRMNVTARILALSGGGILRTTADHGSGASLAPALLLGAAHTLAKPFTRQQLLDAIEVVLASPARTHA